MSSIDYSKLFNSETSKMTEDVSKIDAILEFEEVLYAISEKIINYRKNKKLSQKELAKILNVNQTMISKLERGDYNPTFKQIYNISRKLENSSDIFIEILDNIKTKVKNLLTAEYNLEIKRDIFFKDYYYVDIKKDTNLIELKYNGNIEGDINYGKYTSSISNVG